MSETAALQLIDIQRTYHQAGEPLPVLRGASLTLEAGEIVALVGPSGAGKSTLLHVAGLLERPDGGQVWLEGRDCGRMGDGERTAMRRNSIGFVYQFHHLLPEFTAVENVMLPQMIAGLSKREARERAMELLTMVGLAKRASHRPSKLSGGEQQRVAIVRALANAPRVLIGDEPTGNLDLRTSQRVFATLNQLVRASGLATIVATHNLDIAAQMDRRVTIREGAVVELD